MDVQNKYHLILGAKIYDIPSKCRYLDDIDRNILLSLKEKKQYTNALQFRAKQ